MIATTSENPHPASTESFLREPGSVEYRSLDRVNSKFVSPDHNDELRLDYSQRKYGQQYAHIYFMRLERLRNEALRSGKEAWEGKEFNGLKATHCHKVLDVKQGSLVWIVGTIYKEMKFKPNILEDVAASQYGAPPVHHDQYYDKDSDVVLLEDESGRVQLVGNVVKNELLVTGTVVVVLGTETPDGNLDVADIKFPEYAPQAMRSKTDTDSESSKYVALVSGLDIGGKKEDVEKLNLLQEYLCGELGGQEDQEQVSKVSMLLIGGDSLAEQHIETKSVPNKNDGIKSTPGGFNRTPLQKFDSFVADTALSLPVSIMPGKSDPTNLSMPQQPLNFGLLKQSRNFRESKSVTCVTNPSWWEIDGVRVLGTSGQTIDDIEKYLDIDDRLEMMNRTLRWRHIAPTAPDTLWSYPFADRDPFILPETPHVYFVGNQSEFSTRLIESEDAEGTAIKTRLICLPRFNETGNFVLLNLETLDCQMINIST